MTNPVRTLQPTALWNHFEDINAVPRPSKKEERIIAFMKAFGEGLGLKTVVDSIGNVFGEDVEDNIGDGLFVCWQKFA